MGKNKYQSINTEGIDIDKDDIMNRVNQTFDKLAEDVRNMVNTNDRQNDHTLS